MAAAASAAPIPQDEASRYSASARWIILVAVLLGTILEILDTSIVNVAIPDMMGNLGATIDQINWISTGYIISNVIVLPLTGWLSNQFGRRNYLTASILLFTAASFLCGTANSLNQLILYRILQGAGGAALLSTAQATLLEIFPRKQVAMVQAIFSMGLVTAPTLGPTLGGYIVDTYSWHWIFLVNVPLGLLAAFLVFTFLKDSSYQRASRRIDLVGIGLLAVGLGSLQTLLEKGNRESWFESSLILGLFAASAVALCAFTWWELKIKEPAVQLRVLKDRGFAAGTLMAFVLGFGLYGGVFILPIFLQEIQRFSATQTGLVMLPGGLATTITLPILGRIIAKVDRRLLVLIGGVCVATSMFMLHTMNPNTGPGDLQIPLIIRGIGLACMFLPLSLAALAGLPNEQVPYAAGLYNLTRQLGGSIGIAVLATLLDHRSEVHRSALVEHITSFNQSAMQRLHGLEHMFMAKGFSFDVAHQQALRMMDGMVQKQALTMSFEDGFLLIGMSFVVTLPLLFLFKKGKGTPQMSGGGH